MDIKERILRLIDNNINDVEHNTYIIRRTLGKMTPEQLDKEYEKYGRKCRDVLADAENELNTAREIKTWFINNTL